MRNRNLLLIAGLTLLGLALRIIFMLAMKSNWPGWDSPTIDALYHHLLAKQIAGGDILFGVAGGDAGPFFRAPFYPYFLGLLYSIFGENFTIVRIIQHLVGVMAVPLVYLLARAYFPNIVAILAASITAINGVFIYFESQLLLDFLTVTLYLMIFFLLTKAQMKNSPGLFFAAGLAAGIFAITRPNILAVLPLLVLWIFLTGRHLKSRVKHSMLLLIGAAILILPVTARNIIVGGDNVLIASQGGINFYIGNNEHADGYTALLPGAGHTWQYSDAEFEVASESGRKLGTIKPSEVSAYYYDKAINFILTSPGKFLKLLIKKIYLFWNYFEISNNNNLHFLSGYIGMPKIFLRLFAFIAPLGLVGTILCFRKDRRFWLFPIAVFGYMATVVAFFVTSRFRMPVTPVLGIMAIYTLHQAITAMTKRRYKYLLAIFIATLAVGLLSWSNLYNHHDRSMAMAHYSLGNVYLKKGDYKSADDEYKMALEQAECVPKAHLNLGVIAFYEGDTAVARVEFRNEISSCGPSGKAYNNLSLLKRLQGEFTSAYFLADSAVHFFPNYKEAYISRILASLAADDTAMIKTAVEGFLDIFPLEPAARYYNGLYLLKLGDIDSAGVEFEFASAKSIDLISEYDLAEIYSMALPHGYNPQKIRGRSFYKLGLIYARRADVDSALAAFRQAARLIPDNPDYRANLAIAYDQTGDYQTAEIEFLKAIGMDSAKAFYYYNYALTLGKMARYQEAEKMLAKAVSIKPDFAEAKDKLRTLRQYIGQDEN